MSIKKSFHGRTLRKPGAFSNTTTEPGAGGQTTDTGILFLIGEADAGPGGSAEGIQSFTASAFSQLQAKYRSGPIVDAAKVALAPSRTPGIGGASKFLIWKTNASVQASLTLANTYAIIKAVEYGVGGNRITYKNVLSSETAPTFTGSAPITDFSGLNTQTLLIRQNGGAASTVTFSTPANIAAVVSQINGVVSGLASNSGDTLILTQPAASNDHRTGRGRSLEISSGSALAKLFLTAGLATAADEIEASLEILQPRDLLTQTAVVGGDIAMTLGRDSTGSCTAATVALSSTTLTLTQTGATPSSVTFALSDYPLIGNLVDGVNDLTGWTAACPSALRSQPASTLDHISATGAFSAVAAQMPARIKRDSYAVAQFFASSSIASSTSQATKGLPDTEGRSNLTGGVRAASASSAFDAGFSAALGVEFNVAVACVSQDAASDITAGLTDPSSTYDVEAIHAMMTAHIALRGSIQNRLEAQGVVGYRVASKAAAFEQCASLGTAEVQFCMQDVQVVDAQGNLAWKQPHILAALIAGMRCGSDIGEPLTHKFLAVQGVGHYVNVDTGVVGGDYNPQIDYDAAIDAGVTSTEPAAGAHRVMVDNTTYGADENFVFNRGSVVEAAQYVAKTIRTDAESAFVGRKTAIVTANTVKNRIRTKFGELFADNILSSSPAAPLGYEEASFIVQITGNTCLVKVKYLPVQGLDLILLEFSLGDSSSAA